MYVGCIVEEDDPDDAVVLSDEDEESLDGCLFTMT